MEAPTSTAFEVIDAALQPSIFGVTVLSFNQYNGMCFHSGNKMDCLGYKVKD